MSYLTLAAGIPNFSKAVISLWFRVPKVSMDAAASDESTDPVLSRCIPLLTFGKPQEETNLLPVEEPLCGHVDAYGPNVTAVTGFTHIGQIPLDPCSIVIDCNDAKENNGTGVLAFNIQMGDTATGTGFYVDAASAVGISMWKTPGDPASGAIGDIQVYVDAANTLGTGVVFKFEQHPESGLPNYILPFQYVITYGGLSDFSATTLGARPESFYVKTLPRIEPDKWHHLLLSFDVSKPIVATAPPRGGDPNKFTNWLNISQGATSYAKLWYALDDVDYRGRGELDENGDPTYHMGPYSVDYDVQQSGGGGRPGGPIGDPNGILTKNAWDAAERGTTGGTVPGTNLFGPLCTYNYTPGLIPTKDAIGIPASTKYVNHIYRVETAEFQLFTGVTLDTEVTANRRAFVDNTGAPVDPKQGTKDDPRAPAEKLLGKKPELLLHGSGNWQSGYNTGTLGIKIETDPDGTETVTKLPDGQFKPTGGIEKYKPEPVLEETETA